METKGIFT